MRSIAVQWRRPSGRRRPIADAAVAAIVAVGGLVLAGAVTAGPQGAPDATADATADTVGTHGSAYDGAAGGPRGSTAGALL
ncbi:hypothetical protein [Streptomyces macrosporus]|uniref:hypothetical protein n=1 Tax=Streptomyces macrosporus TaxID=44032 RepID=UPI0031DB5C20